MNKKSSNQDNRNQAIKSIEKNQGSDNGYKQTEIGVIPEDWEVVSIRELTDFHKQGYYTQEKYSNEGKYYLLRGTDMQNIKIDLSTTPKINANEFDYNSYKTLVGDFLIVRSGAIGRYGIVGKDFPKSIFGSYLINFRFKENLMANFFGFLYQSEIITKQISAITQGGGNLNINAENIKSLFIPLPNINEQKAIAQVLSDTDQLIQNLKTLITKKKAIKQGAMQELLTGKKRLQGFTEEWEVKKLGEVAFIKTGSKNNQDKIPDGNFPFFVRSQSVERINTYSYDCEAILVPGEGGIGSIFHYINGKFDVHQRVYIINDFSQNVFGKYVYLFMKEHFGTHAMKNSVKATVDSLRLPTFQEFEIKIPKDIQEQQAIAQILSDMDAEIEALEQQLQKIQALKQGMMQELLTGKIRLVKPATQEKTETLAMVAEPKSVYKKS